ncbi:MAG: T9SS type A sorting domain-containing protein [Flavobacteriales bacterium]|nr:T9SS type A sorting domain-containing protein [Flavobacteriales bacterium]
MCYANGPANPLWNTTCADCLGVPNGNAQVDACGVCYANGPANPLWNTTCADCLGVPNGNAQVDACSVCYANGPANPLWNSTCADCEGAPNGPAQPGTPCDDDDELTDNDTWTTGCACEGTPIGNCTEFLTIEIRTDVNGSQTSWEVRELVTNILAASGDGYADDAVVTDDMCLAEGCYRLTVFDAGFDGIAGGGYILRTSGNPGQRIIDNRANFSAGQVSAIANGEGFCVPLGISRLIFTSCDKLDWVNNQFIVANDEAAVNAEWIVGGANGVQDTNTGYEFWFFNPNGGYSFRRFRSHATSDGYPATGPTRACHTKVNTWAAANHIPAFQLMNVRVRSRINGDYNPWGPACRFKIDPVRAACPLTKLEDIPGNSFYSCNVTRAWGQMLYCKKVTNATQYQFRFRNAELVTPVVRTRTTWNLQMNWTPALPSGSYQVDVRAFLNGQWCISGAEWGDACMVTITGSPGASDGQQNLTLGSGLAMDATMTLSPNPNGGDWMQLHLNATQDGIENATLEVYDLVGQRVMTTQVPVNGGQINGVVELSNLASGTYLVNLVAGTERYTQRLVISR